MSAAETDDLSHVSFASPGRPFEETDSKSKAEMAELNELLN